MESSRISDGNMMITDGKRDLDSYITELLKQEFEIVVVDITMPNATLLICNLEYRRKYLAYE
jgi:endo-alpha-1,4-polygalactosaminidase (GH114 family)